MKVFALSAKTMQIIAKYLIGILPISLSNILVHSLRMYQFFAVCRTYCTGHRHRPLSQHGLTKAILGESAFAIDLASISYIGREESIAGHGSSPPCKKRLNYAVKPFFYFPRKDTKKRQKTLCVNSDVKFVIS